MRYSQKVILQDKNLRSREVEVVLNIDLPTIAKNLAYMCFHNKANFSTLNNGNVTATLTGGEHYGQ